MKVKKGKGKKTPKIGSNDSPMKIPSKKAQWKNVKLSGNLMSDDGGLGLEGLLGLEVLENPQESVKVTKERFIRIKDIKVPMAEENSDESDSERSSKNQRKKKKKSLKKAAEKAAAKAAAKANKTLKNEPGQFVRPLAENDDDDASKPITNDKKKKSKKQMKQKHKPNVDVKSDESALTINDLVGWNGFDIAEPILRVMAEKGFKEPTEIQALTFPAAIMGRRDILGAAETGSGKTLAFGIPIINGILHMKKYPEKMHFRKLSKKKAAEPEADLEDGLNKHHNKSKKKPKKKQVDNRNRGDRDNLTPPPEEVNNFPSFVNEERALDDAQEELIENNSKPLYALILTPTRELAVQVKDHLVAAAKYTDIHVAAVFGGMAAVKQERILSKCPEIVVATPGRLWELLNEGNAHLNKLENINFLVVDETDRMIEKGHFEEVAHIIDRLNADSEKKAQRQNFIFSATLTLTHELPQYLKLKNLNRKRKFQPETAHQKLDALIQYFDISQPKIVDVTKSEHGTTGIAKKIMECRISCSHEHKDLYLYYFLQKHPGRTIVFCNSIDCVRRLAKLFAILECEPQALHAKMAQRARLKSLERFTKNPTGLLIATDVAARGLDIPNVEHVIHYQVPRTTENYIHRSGRTARGNKEGIAILLMEPEEVTGYVKLCRALKRGEDLPLFPVSDRYLDAVRERVHLARNIDVKELHMRRKNADIGWLKKSAKEMDILIDDESDFSEADLYGSDDETGIAQRSIEQRELKHLKESLKRLIAKPIFPKGFSYKYPSTITIDPNTPDSIKAELGDRFSNDTNQNALNVMKNAIEDDKVHKKKRKSNV